MLKAALQMWKKVHDDGPETPAGERGRQTHSRARKAPGRFGEITHAMCPLRRVEDREAGPAALGVLLPPGRQTFLILRPRPPLRSASAAHPGVPAFCQLEAIAAPGMAQKVYRALEQRRGRGAYFLSPSAAGGRQRGCCRMPRTQGSGCRSRSGLMPWWYAAGRPGSRISRSSLRIQRRHRPWSRLAGILCPPADFEQEVYFNDRHFTS